MFYLDWSILGRLRSEVKLFTLLYPIFGKKRYLFRIPSIDKRYPFTTPSLEFCIHFNCCKYLIIQSPQGFSGIIYNTGWGMRKEWVMMPPYVSVKVRSTSVARADSGTRRDYRKGATPFFSRGQEHSLTKILRRFRWRCKTFPETAWTNGNLLQIIECPKGWSSPALVNWQRKCLFLSIAVFGRQNLGSTLWSTDQTISFRIRYLAV